MTPQTIQIEVDRCRDVIFGAVNYSLYRKTKLRESESANMDAMRITDDIMAALMHQQHGHAGMAQGTSAPEPQHA